MTIISTTKSPESLTLTVVAEFPAPPDRVWALWEDPRRLEQWWGPPMFPATFTRHDFTVGGESRYFMTGPDGERYFGYWQTSGIACPHQIDFLNGLAGSDGEPDPEMSPMPSHVTLERIEIGTRMTVVTTFIDTAQMEKMIGMGMAEGMAAAIGQIDPLVVAELT